MERFLPAADAARPVQLAVGGVLAERAATKTRASYTAEQMKAVVELCRNFGPAAAVRRYNADHGTNVPEGTAKQWFEKFRANVLGGVAVVNAYPQPAKRGRKEFLSPGEKSQVNEAIDKIRAPPNAESLSAREVGSIARGIVERSRPALLQKHGGPAKLGKAFGRKFLRREDCGPRHATTDRTVSVEALSAASGPFFAGLRRLATEGVRKELLFGLDEWFVILWGALGGGRGIDAALRSKFRFGRAR